MVAPQAMAGASLWAASSTGKLNGVIPAMGASGKRRVIPQRPLPCGIRSSGITSPPIRRASSAPWPKTKMARSTSVRAMASGFPASLARQCASSSRRAATPALIRSSTAARSCEGSAAAVGAAATARSTACSTSRRPAIAAEPTTEPVHGLRTTAASAEATRAPSRR